MNKQADTGGKEACLKPRAINCVHKIMNPNSEQHDLNGLLLTLSELSLETVFHWKLVKVLGHQDCLKLSEMFWFYQLKAETNLKIEFCTVLTSGIDHCF